MTSTTFTYSHDLLSAQQTFRLIGWHLQKPLIHESFFVNTGKKLLSFAKQSLLGDMFLILNSEINHSRKG